MKLPEIGVKRPVFTALIFVAVLMSGIVAMRMLPTDVLPDIELPTLTVITVYPGASAEEVEQQVTKKLEETLSGSENLKKITSRSKENVSFITLQYQWNSDLNEASANARDLIEMAKRKLPDAAEDPTILRINSSMLPVIIYGVNARESYNGISRIIDDKITNPLKKLQGVGSVIVLGEPSREIKINVNPEKLKAYHLSVTQIAQYLKLGNVSIPGGNIKVGVNEFAVTVPAEFKRVNEISGMAVSIFNGKVIRLGDIAEIRDGFREKDEIIRVNDKHAIGLLVQKQSGANTVQVAEALRAEVSKIQKTLPPDVEMKELMDSSILVTASIDNLTETIFYAALFVILVVFLFLRNARSSLIVILSIPFSLIVAFIYMYFAEFTINIFSLMSLAVAIGVVVDNAIVVLDNITRHIEKGVHPRTAAVIATSEMGLAISASTFTIIAVFLPMMFMGGLVGIMFRQLAILTSVTLLASLITSLLLTPMMASRMLRSAEEEHARGHSKIYLFSERLFVALENAYKTGLEWAVRHKLIVITTSLGLFLITLFMAKNVGTDYIPEFDAGDITIVFQTEVGTNVYETERVARQVEAILRQEVPELKSFFTVVGQTESGLLSAIGFREGKNISTLMAKIVPPEDRKRSAKEIAGILRSRLAEIPEIDKYNVSGGSFLSAALLGNIKPIQVNLMGNNLQELNAVADSMSASFRKMKNLTNIETTVDKGKMEIRIELDQEKAASLGLNSVMAAMQVRQSIYGAEAGNYKEDGDEYRIVVRYDSASRNNIENLSGIMLSTLTGQQVPVASVARITTGMGPLEIAHEAQQRVVSVNADLKDITLGEATRLVTSSLKLMNIPSAVDASIGGQVTEQEDSFASLRIMFIAGVLLVYMIMASQFESFKDPFIILFTVPLSVIGVIWAFLLTGISLSVVTFVALIMLIGIDVNNGIILVDYTNMMRKRGHPLLEAAAESGRLRLRPVLMTSLIAILGMIPLAVSSGIGSEIWSPFGITCIGGLIVSKFFTMFLIPTLYVAMNRDKQRGTDHGVAPIKD